MESIALLLRTGEAELELAGVPDARREASSLLAAALGSDRTFLIAHPDHVPDTGHKEQYLDYLARRSRREPFHYIIGKKEFYSLEFAVTPAVLIPRPETEMLVERSIGILRDIANPAFCEVGIGSGCISVSILANVSNAVAVGMDISEAATEIARQNIKRHGVGDRCELRRSDVLSGLFRGEMFDLIVSNPPYVPAGDIDGLQAEVRDHEPYIALSGGKDGLKVVRKLVEDSPNFLKPGGILMFECGFSQSQEVLQMFASHIWSSAAVESDLQGIPRIVTARLNDR
jgi:release factor glutamine methyltransferase